ncbi:MAG TPA: hypothetical protein VLC49_10345, partial [Solirubrobacteraceae bacterium]|nr:hypothetical protein [Solirubrobacteraceae bacterium]
MTSAAVHESVEAERAAPGAGPRSSPAPAGLDGLRAAAGNRGFGSFVRTLARQPATQAARPGPVTVGLATPPPPPPIHASERATIPNQRLAALIDEIDKLSGAEVIERRRSEVLEAEAVSGPDAGSHQLALEAAEYVAGHRRLAPLKAYYTVDTPTNRRRNIRVALEEGVREHHSFKKAFAQLADSPASADARRFFEHEEQAFRTAFSRQAKATALAMLDASQREMERVLIGYGLPVQAALYAADELSRDVKDADADSEATAVIKRALRSGDVDTQEHQDKRQGLAETVGRLKRQKALFEQLEHEAGRAALDVPINGTGPKADAMMAKKAQAQAERVKLRRMWIEAERSHPILTAYRHGGEVEKVDLGTLDTDPVNTEMHAVLAKLLPKLGDLLEAKRKISAGEKHLSALSIPSVVAMTKANMFIPRGSIRDGIANDLAEEAGTESKWIILGAILLALVTFLPTGGASLGIAAGMASVGMAAYSAVHDWEKYSQQKMLSDTDLDIARSLSTEEPSLTPFIVSLVSLGLEPLALLSAFNKARRIKALANSGEDATALVNELNQITSKSGKKLEEALDELEAEQQGSKAAKSAEAAAPKIPKIKDTAFGWLDRADARKQVMKGLSAIKGDMPERWDMVKAALRQTDRDVNRQLLGLVDRHMAALRDVDAWADVLADAWEIAAKMRKPNLRTALLKLAKQRGIKKFVKLREVLEGGAFFDEVAITGKGIIDPALAVGTDGIKLHGELTHLIQDLVVDSKLGRGASAEFRQLLKDAEGTIERYVEGQPGVVTRFGAFANTLGANVTFLPDEVSMKTGDYVWRFTYDLFYGAESLRRMPQPEA